MSHNRLGSMGGVLSLHIGLDSLDRGLWGCTTYYLYMIVKEIIRSRLRSRLKFIDYPLLTRLNPAIPLKTRGNGAVSLHLRGYEEDLREAVEIASQIVGSGRVDSGKGGAIALYGDLDRSLAVSIYMRGLSDYISIDQAKRYIVGFAHRVLMDGRGVVGSLISIAHHFVSGDYTFELIGYSESGGFSVDRSRVEAMDRATRPLTFGNIDPDTGRVLITPRVGRPTVLGVRGEVPDVLIRSIEILDPVGLDGYMVFRSNQATDQHMVYWGSVSQAKLYRTGVFIGRLESRPKVLRGGDVLFDISDGSGHVVGVAVFKELGYGNYIARKLLPGDLVLVGGSVKPWIIDGFTRPVINVEMFKILRVAEVYRLRNPRCRVCGGSMSSLGSGKGFRCKRCGFRDYGASKIRERIYRDLPVGVVFKPPTRYQKHLTKPLERFGFEKVWVYRSISLDIGRYIR